MSLLSLPVPVSMLDNGPFLKTSKPWWSTLLRAQRKQMTAIFHEVTTISDLDGVDDLPAASVLIIPALAGGCVEKWQWWSFRAKLRTFRARGGLVVFLQHAFCLPAEDKRARGRNFERLVARHPGDWYPGTVRLELDPSCANAPEYATLDLGRALPKEIDTGHGFWSEHTLEVSPADDERWSVLASAGQGKKRSPIAIQFAERPHVTSGAMLFLSVWGWQLANLAEAPRSGAAKGTDRVKAEAFNLHLLAVHRALICSTMAWIHSRVAERVERLELVSGEGERLGRNLGAEKDYHRLLANDFELCLDVLSWRSVVEEDRTADRMRKKLAGGWIWAEPPHRKAQKQKGRLDLLLFAAKNFPEEQTAPALEAFLQSAGRGPVAWVELEAGPMNEGQVTTFVKANRDLLRKGDFVCTIDRSRDDEPVVGRVRNLVAPTGADFVHVRVPDVFDRLDEHYAPLSHRTMRKRFTTEIIRGLLG